MYSAEWTDPPEDEARESAFATVHNESNANKGDDEADFGNDTSGIDQVNLETPGADSSKGTNNMVKELAK